MGLRDRGQIAHDHRGEVADVEPSKLARVRDESSRVRVLSAVRSLPLARETSRVRVLSAVRSLPLAREALSRGVPSPPSAQLNTPHLAFITPWRALGAVVEQ